MKDNGGRGGGGLAVGDGKPANGAFPRDGTSPRRCSGRCDRGCISQVQAFPHKLTRPLGYLREGGRRRHSLRLTTPMSVTQTVS